MSKRYLPAAEMPAVRRKMLADTIDRLLFWLERSRQRRRLGRLSNHMLKDIGLTRADIEFEMVKRPWEG
jgi:uncharacterized protein YjiS (DUF1127 family)